MVTSISKAALAGVVCAAVLVSSGLAHSQGLSFGWSISASPTQAYVNHVPFPGPSVQVYHLWLLCVPGGGSGLSSAEFALAPSGANTVISFTPESGFVNAGTATNLLLSHGSCPTGPVLVGNILAVISEPGNICLTTSQGGTLGSVDCSLPFFDPDTWRGIDFGGQFCRQGFVCDVIDGTFPCCFPDGSCSQIPAIDFGEYCDGAGGYGPPVQFCSDWNCAPVAADESRRTAPWGRVKAQYQGR